MSSILCLSTKYRGTF